MSFILDALKKSESDRQRQGGPALFEVKIAPPRHALPPWAVAIAVLLVANLGVVAWFMLRHAAAPASGEASVASASARAPAPAAAEPAPQALAAVVAAPAAAPAARTVISAPTPAPAPAPPPAAARSAAADATAEPASNPDDFAPAAEPPPSGGLGRVKRGTTGVPLYQQLAATPGTQLPQLRLDLHAYAEHPGDRWVLINMHKLREGESLEGVHVDRITPEGAVLSYQGSQFLLTRE